MNLNAQIELEVWDVPAGKRKRLHEATVPNLREALLRLDGKRVDCVWIEIQEVGALCVGGGPSRFVVASFPINGSSAHVVHDGDGPCVQLRVGGQSGVYPGSMVLSSEVAFAISERFLITGMFDFSLNWTEDRTAEEA